MRSSPFRASTLLLASCSLLLLFLSLEIGLRIAPRAIPLHVLLEFEPGLRDRIAARLGLQRFADTVPIPRHDGGPQDRLWRYRPGAEVTLSYPEEGIVETVRMDENGFCNEPADAYGAARFDVIAVGDSFTWCTSVVPGDAWPAKLAQLTGRSVYNLGLPSRGLHESVETLRAFGLAKHPRVVVLNAYEGNDLRDAYYFHHEGEGGVAGLGAGGCPFASGFLCDLLTALRDGPLGRRSYALGFAVAVPWALAAQREQREIDFQYEVTFRDGSQMTFNSRNGDLDEVQFARRLADGRISTHLLDDALEAFARLARQHGFFALVTYSPSAYTAYAGQSRFSDPAIEGTLRAYSEALRAYFARETAALDLAFLDLTPALQRAAREGLAADRPYFRTQVHFTPRGNAVVAREVAHLLDERGLLPADDTGLAVARPHDVR